MSGNNKICPSHEAHVDSITRNEKDIQKLFTLDEKTTNKIDTMKNMIIAGLFGSGLQLVLLLIGLVFAYLKLRA